MSWLIRRLSDRCRGDAGYAMMMALFLLLLVSVTSLAVAGLYFSEVTPTRLANKRVQTVDAASAGLQAALGQLRNTTSSSGVGDLTKLPCSDVSDHAGVAFLLGSTTTQVPLPGYQITGTVAATSGNSTGSYRAVISYFATDPTSHETDTISNPNSNWWTSNAITCKDGLVNSVPAYAFIQSFGADTAATGLQASIGDRTLHAIYQFRTTNGNTQGGRLAEYNASAPDTLCIDAGTNPGTGTTMTMQPCKALGTAQQSWLYRQDLTIQYGGNTSLNLCIQNVTGIQGQNGTLRLEPCETSGSGQTYPYADATQQEQEWAYNDNGHLQEPDVSDGKLGLGCMEPYGATTANASYQYASLIITACPSNGSPSDPTAWYPDPQVGAGKSSGSNPNGLPSSSPNSQMVNFALFGNCIDVAGQNFANNLIAYPCKQAPDSTTLTWNQIWHFQVVSGNYGILYTSCSAGAGGCIPSSPSSNVNDCLVSPTTENALVSGAQCPTGTTPNNELWLPTGNIVNNYSGSYLFINKSSGYCLAADPSQSYQGWARIVVTNCNGADVPSTGATKNSLLLKWNAAAQPPASGLHDVGEDNGSVTSAGNGG